MKNTYNLFSALIDWDIVYSCYLEGEEIPLWAIDNALAYKVNPFLALRILGVSLWKKVTSPITKNRTQKYS